MVGEWGSRRFCCSMKRQRIQEQLKKIEERLRNAEEYVAQNENVESSSFLHFKDWEGKSGHPLWMKNFMIPAAKRARAVKERALERIIVKKKEKPADEKAANPGAPGGANPGLPADLNSLLNPVPK